MENGIMPHSIDYHTDAVRTPSMNLTRKHSAQIHSLPSQSLSNAIAVRSQNNFFSITPLPRLSNMEFAHEHERNCRQPALLSASVGRVAFCCHLMQLCSTFHTAPTLRVRFP